MPKSIWLLAASAALAAAPAAAQDNAADTAVNTTVNETVTTDANAVIDANLVATVPDANALEPAPPAESDLATRADDNRDERRGFPWGILGLVGLIGLLGRRKNS